MTPDEASRNMQTSNNRNNMSYEKLYKERELLLDLLSECYAVLKDKGEAHINNYNPADQIEGLVESGDIPNIL